MNIAAVLFGLAAVGGLTMATIVLRGAPRPPTWMALGHGAIGAAGLVTLILAAIDPGIPRLAQVALGMFVLAALGGLTLFGLFHLKGRPLPIPFVLGHGLLAASAFGLLLFAVFG